MLKVVYPGTFDPFTRGHEDLVRRASRLFDVVIVGVADSEAKRPYFTAAERVEMAKAVLAPYPNVVVESFSGLLMNFVHDQGAQVILRGLRAVSDFEYEFQMAQMNHRIGDLETFFMTTDPRWSYLSSSLLKEVARFGGDVEGLGPASVRDRLSEKLGRTD